MLLFMIAAGRDIFLSLFLAGTIVLMLGVLTVVGTFLSDLLLIAIDPRIRLGGSR